MWARDIRPTCTKCARGMPSLKEPGKIDVTAVVCFTSATAVQEVGKRNPRNNIKGGSK